MGSGDYEKGQTIDAAAAAAFQRYMQRLGPFELFNPTAWFTIEYDAGGYTPLHLAPGPNLHALMSDVMNEVAARTISIQSAGTASGANATGFFNSVGDILGNALGWGAKFFTCYSAALLAGTLAAFPAIIVTNLLHEFFDALARAPNPYVGLTLYISKMVALITAIGVSILQIVLSLGQVTLLAALERAANRAHLLAEARGGWAEGFARLRVIHSLHGIEAIKAITRFEKLTSRLALLGQTITIAILIFMTVSSAITTFVYCWTKLSWPKIARAAAPVRHVLVRPDEREDVIVDALTADYSDRGVVLRFPNREAMAPYVHWDPSSRTNKLAFKTYILTGINLNSQYGEIRTNTVNSPSDLTLNAGRALPGDCGLDSFGFRSYQEYSFSPSVISLCYNLTQINRGRSTDLSPVESWLGFIPHLGSFPFLTHAPEGIDVTQVEGRDEFWAVIRNEVHQGEGESRESVRTMIRIEGPTVPPR